jgi:surface antigen
MDAYRAKEIMWTGMVLMCILIGLLSGCSSTQPMARSEQFCDLKTVTDVQRDLEGKIIGQKSNERMVCSDNRIDRIVIKQAGMAKNCGEYTYYITLHNRSVEQRGLACEKFNGNWEIIPNYGYR